MEAPLAIMALRNIRVWSPTARLFAEVKWPLPKYRSMPSFTILSAESCSLILVLTSRSLFITAGKSTLKSGTFIPNVSEFCISLTSLEERISDLEGTQPKFRQSPPRNFFSISAVFAQSLAPPIAATSPADPAPITTRSYVPAGTGFCQFSG